MSARAGCAAAGPRPQPTRLGQAASDGSRVPQGTGKEGAT